MIEDTCAEARKLFAKKDKLAAELRATEDRLRTLRYVYMAEARVWAISTERFRQDAHNTKAAA